MKITKRSRAPHALSLTGTMLIVIATFLVYGCASVAPVDNGPPVAPLALTGALLDVHDPSSIIKDGNRYYLFSTGPNIPIRCSSDLHSWKDCGQVFTTWPDWVVSDIPAADNIWAPDISYYDGSYHLYFAVSTFGSNRSDIGLLTNPTLNPKNPSYRWVDRGKVIQSMSFDDWNAIDPNLVLDANGQPWLAFGSFWSGLKLVKIDPATGKPAPGAQIHSIAERPQPPDAIEASFIIYRDGYYYLFASFDFCCRGSDSTYNIRIGRSKAITGPYVDESGVPMLEGGGTPIAEGGPRWRGPGGESVFHESDDTWWLIYHSYDASLAGAPTLRISPLIWNSTGWPRPVTPIAK